MFTRSEERTQKASETIDLSTPLPLPIGRRAGFDEPFGRQVKRGRHEKGTFVDLEDSNGVSEAPHPTQLPPVATEVPGEGEKSDSEEQNVTDRTDTPLLLYYSISETGKFKDSVSAKNPVGFKGKKAGADLKVRVA